MKWNCPSDVRCQLPWSRLAIACLILVAGPRALALDPAEKPANYIAAHWDTEDGLPHNLVRCIFQTRDGYLWVGTQQGLARFDGLTFTVFNQHNTPEISSTIITSFAETRDGSLWVGTSVGLLRYQDGRFKAYGRADGLKADTVNSLCVAPDGSLWIGGREGITRWINGKFINDIDTSAFDMRGMRFVGVDRHNAIWIASGFDALRCQDGKFTRFSQAEGLPAQQVRMIREDGEGNILAVTYDGLLRLCDGRFVPFEKNHALSNPRVDTALADQAGNLWIGSPGGLDRYSGGKVIPYTDRNGDHLAGVIALFEDREHCLWAGTSSGLYRFIDRRASLLALESSDTETLISTVMQSRDGALWIGKWMKGVDRIQNGVITHYAAGAPLSPDTVTVIYESPDGTMWFGNRGSSLDRLVGNKVTTFVYQSGVISSRAVTAICQDTNGELLVGISRRGLLQLADGKLSPVPEAKAFADDTVWTIKRARDGRLLMGTDKGLYQRSADRTWRQVALGGRNHPVGAHALLEEDGGSLWIATEGDGLVRWENGREHTYTTREGMVDDVLFSVLDDNHGSLWVNSARGIGRIRKAEFDAIDRGAAVSLNCLTFGRADGLLNASTSGNGAPSALCLADGSIVAATDEGVVMIDQRRVKINTQPPPVVIESVIVDDQPLVHHQKVLVPAGAYRLEIHYSALSLVAPERLRFRYQLRGSDPGWIEAGHQRQASYTHLSPGHYTFRVLACNNDGVWNEDGAALDFTVQPFFYQTAWFIGLVVLTTGGAGFGIYRARVRRARRRTAELERLVTERTRELQSAKEAAELAVNARNEVITNLKRAEARLAESLSLLHATLDSTADGILVVSTDGKKILQNQRTVDLWKIPLHIAEGDSDDTQVRYVMNATTKPDEFQERVMHFHIHPDESGQDEIELKDGTILERVTAPILGKEGRNYGRIWTFRDVTQRKQAEAELAYERHLLRALLENSTDHIYFKDTQSRFIKCSNAQARQFGVGSADDLAGKSDFDFFTEEHARPAFEDEQTIIRTGQPMIGRIERESWKDGRGETWVLTTKMPLRDKAGETIGTFGISKDITPIKEAEARLKAVHRELVDASRQAGMAEVATSVLHNVGNVLNSVNVSTILILDTLRKSKLHNLGRLAAIIREHQDDLAAFFTADPKGRKLPDYLTRLAEHLAGEQADLLKEVELTRQHVEHIKDIVTMQQSYAKVSGVVEKTWVVDLIEDALRLNGGALVRHDVQVIRDFPALAIEINVDRQKVLQVLVNLIRNAKYACDESSRSGKQLTMQVRKNDGRVKIAVMDNGVGIPAENMTRIFNHGFTTREQGHGFGLHSGALAAKEMGGVLTAHSDGPGQGATFVLDLPLQPVLDSENSGKVQHDRP